METPSPELMLKPRLLPPATVVAAVAVVVALVGVTRWSRSAPGGAAGRVDSAGGRTMSQKRYTKPSDAELRKKLSGVQYEVTQNAATEPPFDNAYWNNHQAGPRPSPSEH